VRESAFERLRQLRKDLTRLFQRRGHTLFFIHVFECGRVRANRVRSKRPARARVGAWIGREPFDRKVRRRVTAQAVSEPEPRARLQKHFHRTRVVLFADRLLFRVREPSVPEDLANHRTRNRTHHAIGPQCLRCAGEPDRNLDAAIILRHCDNRRTIADNHSFRELFGQLVIPAFDAIADRRPA
jgi:hypothetical protein